MKKITSVLLCILLMLSYSFYAFASGELDGVISDASCYIIDTVHEPTVSSIGGEWSVIGLAGAKGVNSDTYIEKYYKNAEEYIKNCGGVLHKRKYTEYARVILGLISIGENPENIEGYNITLPLLDYDNTIKQGLNGPIWALIALNSGNYGDEHIKEKYVERILSSELSGGGFALSSSEENADVDITSMALIALSAYNDREEVKTVTERALARLSSMQNDTGGFSNYGIENSESTSQVIMALTALGISHDDSRFVKNGVGLLDNLLSYHIDGSGFSHVKGEEVNLMATEQALCALVAVKHMENGESHIYDTASNYEKYSDHKFEKIAKSIYNMLKETGII